jgi:hypothetical protein
MASFGAARNISSTPSGGVTIGGRGGGTGGGFGGGGRRGGNNGTGFFPGSTRSSSRGSIITDAVTNPETEAYNKVLRGLGLLDENGDLLV